MQLPMPSGKIINIIEGNGDPNLEILYNQIANSLANVSYEYELPTETILLFNKFIRALPTTNLDVLPINISQENPNLSFNEFERLLNKHTTYTDYSTSPYSVKNSIVQKINKVISSASNQINANTPVDVQPLHDAIRNVQNKRNGQTQPKNVSSSNNINSSNNNEIGNPNIVFRTSSFSDYKDRTYENASADATIALATDFNSFGELATKVAVLGQNKKYIPIDANNLNVTPERVDKIVNELNNLSNPTPILNYSKLEEKLQLSTKEKPIIVYVDGSDIKGTGAIGFGVNTTYDNKEYSISGSFDTNNLSSLEKDLGIKLKNKPSNAVMEFYGSLVALRNTPENEYIVIRQDLEGVQL
jgi:hypothetical protein